MEIEETAKRQGWVPKENFRGDPERWISAEDFVKRADEMMPILKSVNKKYETQILDLTGKLTKTQEMIGKMVKVQSKYSDDFYDTKAAELDLKLEKAVEAGDKDTYKTLKAQRDKIVKPEPIKVEETKTTDGLHPEVARWQNENSTWYGKDGELTEYADIIADRISKKGHSMDPYDFCEEVGKRVKHMFPDKFKNPNQNNADIDESSFRGAETPKGKKGWNELPKEAKQQCEKLLLEIPGYTKEKYLSDYFEV